MRKHRDIKLATTNEKRSKLISEPNYHTTKKFSENLLAIEMKKTKVKINKPVYLDMSILDISSTLMYKSWYDYIKPKYEDRAKLCYNYTDSFIIHILYEDIADENDKRPLPIGMNKRVYCFFKDGLGRKIMKEFVPLRAKTYAYLTDDDSEKKKAKGTKNWLLNDKVILKSEQRFESNHHKVYTEEVNKITLSSDDDKRLQTFDGIKTYPYGTTNDMLRVFESKENVLKI